MKIILASASKDRERCFNLAGIPIEIIPSNFDENSFKQSSNLKHPEQIIKELALKKAEIIAKRWNYTRASNEGEAIIIAADTMVQINDDLIGKPKNKEDAFDMISKLVGKYHTIYTGVSIIKTDTNEHTTFIKKCKVHFQYLQPSEIHDYLNISNEYKGRAGGYSLRNRASLFIDYIEGSPTNVIGLPMAKLRQILKNYGVNLLKT